MPMLLAEGNSWAIVLIVAAAGLMMWWLLRPRYDFTIDVDNNDVNIRGQIAKIQQGKVAGFFQDDVQFDGQVKIMGTRQPDGRLVLRFRGPVDQATRQRIRNFLLTVL